MQNFLKEFTDGKITRREFMGRMAMIGVATTLPLAFSDKKAMAAATPNKGGILRVVIAHGSTTETYDPATIPSGTKKPSKAACQYQINIRQFPYQQP